MTKQDKIDLFQVAILIEANNYISASSAGLKERAENRKKAINILLTLIGITITEFEEKFIQIKGRSNESI